MVTPSPFGSLKIPQGLACEFFAVFSCFEFALKECGFFYVNRHKHAVPDWERFAAASAGTLQVAPCSELYEAINFLTQKPPQVQVSAHEWESQPLRGTTDVAKAIDAAQRVRHNLFHGGKHTLHSAPGRDEQLVRASLAVLHACLAQDDKLRAAYEH